MSAPASKPSGPKAPIFKFFVGSRSKVRTGCITCKIRRIKCDEAKPSCDRCTSTGRKCDGYATPQSRKKRQEETSGSSKVKSRPSRATMSELVRLSSQHGVAAGLAHYPDCTTGERRSLDFFYQWSTNKMAGWHGKEFWYGHVPRAGYSEPAVRHAMIALAITHEQLVVIKDGIPNDPRMDKMVCHARKMFALQHYGAAVSRLAKIMAEKGSNAQKLALINCMIFIIIDFLWGNVATAMVHAQSGADILNKWKEKHGDDANAGDSLEGLLVPLLHGTTFGNFSPPSKQATPEELPAGDFGDLETARRLIEKITAEAHQLVRTGAAHEGEAKGASRTPKERRTEDDLRQELELWLAKFEGLQSSLGLPLSPEQEEEVTSLRLLQCSGVVWLWSIADPQPEQPLDVFRKLITIAEDLVQVCQRHGEDASQHIRQCIYDTRIWFSYSLVAKSCSDGSVKERATALLANIAADREGEGGPHVKRRTDNWKTWVKMTEVED